MYLSRAQCLRALEVLGLTTILYTSPYAGSDNALVPLQRMLDAVALARGENAPTITADGYLWHRRAGRQPDWLQEIYGHLSWRGLPIQDITAWHVAHLLRKTYRTAHGFGQRRDGHMWHNTKARNSDARRDHRTESGPRD